ncbi:MAG: hypothetical protein WDN06_11010 [Asticcacaulis sp.]
MFIAALAVTAALQTATPGGCRARRAAGTICPPVWRPCALARRQDHGHLRGHRPRRWRTAAQRHHLRDGTTGAVIRTLDPCTTCRYSDAAWTPDSRSFAVVGSDMKASTVTVYSVPAAGGDATTLTGFTGLAARLRWSPDGKTLAMLAVVNPHKQVGATQAGAAQVGEIGVAGVIDEQRIATVSHAGDQPAFMSPSDTWVYEYDWKPTGDGFVATAAKGDGDNNWWVAKLESLRQRRQGNRDRRAIAADELSARRAPTARPCCSSAA